MISSTQMVRVSAIACTLIASTHLYAMHSGNAAFKRAQEATSTLIDGQIKSAVDQVRRNALRAIDGMQLRVSDSSDRNCEGSPANSESPTNLPGSDISQPSTPPLAATAEESSSPESTPTALVQSLTAMAKPVMGKNCMAVAPKALIRDVRGTRPGQPGYEKEFPSLGTTTQPKKPKFERTKKKRPVVAHAVILPKVAQPVRDETALVLSQPHLKFQAELDGLENVIRAARADKTKRTDMSELQERMKTARHIIDGKQLASQDDCQRFTNIERSWFAWLEELNHSQENTNARLHKTPFVVSQEVAQAIISAAPAVNTAPTTVVNTPVAPTFVPALNVSDVRVERATAIAPIVASRPMISHVDAKALAAPVASKMPQASAASLAREILVDPVDHANVVTSTAPQKATVVDSQLVVVNEDAPTTSVLAPAPNVARTLVAAPIAPKAKPTQPAFRQSTAPVVNNPSAVANEGENYGRNIECHGENAPVVPARASALNISDALVEPAAVVAPVEPVANSVDAKVHVAPVMRKSHQARLTNLVKEMPITSAHSDISASVASAAAPKGIAEVAAKAAEVAIEAAGPKIRSALLALIIQPTAHNQLVAANTQVPTTPVLAPAPALNVSDALAEHANATVEEVAVESAASPEAEPVQPALVQAASVADNPLIVANEGMSVDNKRILASARVREMRGMFHTHRDYARNFPTLDTKPVAQAPAVEPMAARTPINLGELEALCQLINAHRQHVQATGDDTLDERDREIIRTLSKGLEKLRKMATRGQLNDEDLTYFKRIKAQYEDILPSKWPVHTLAAGVVAEESAIVPFVEPVNAEPASVGAAVVAALIPAANNALVEYAPRTATVAVADIAPAPVAEVAVGNSAEPALAQVGQSVVAAPEVIANHGNAALVDHNPAAVGQLQVARTNGWWRSWGRQATWCALPVVIAIIAAVIGRKNGASWWPWRTTLRRHRVRPIRVP